MASPAAPKKIKKKPAAEGTPYLAESEEFRKRWCKKIPPGLEGKYDSVKYAATPLPGQTGDRIRAREMAGAACYSGLWPDYSRYDITCSPQHSSHADEKLFLRFFEVMVEAGIVPPQAEFYVKKGTPHLHIADQSLSTQEIYPALCCYRWTDSNPPLVYNFLKLYDDQRHPWSAFQILPYVIARFIENCNHSFITTTPWGRSQGAWRNPLLGVAARIFFDPQDERKGSIAHINESVGEICNSLSESVAQPSGDRWSPTRTTASFLVETKEDLLSPRLIPLYEMKKPGKKKLQTALKKIFEEQGG